MGAGLTSFYMFRLIFLTFFGAPRFDEHNVHVHESPKNMTVPLVILAFLSIFGGWFAAPHLVGGTEYFDLPASCFFLLCAGGNGAALQAIRVRSAASAPARRWNFFTPLRDGPSSSGSGPAPGVVVVHQEPGTPKRLAQSLHGLYLLLLNKYYVDEIYAALLVRPLLWISDIVFWHVVDEGIIDGAVNARRARPASGGKAPRTSIGQCAQLCYLGRDRRGGFTVLLLGLWDGGANVGNQPLLLTVITFLPLLSVAALLLLRSDDHVWIRRIAFAASLAEFVISLLLLRGFYSGTAAISSRNSRLDRLRRFITIWASMASACFSFC